jgi:hypothetical protein
MAKLVIGAVLVSVCVATLAPITVAADSKSFHGLQILDWREVESSNNDGDQAIARVRLGPYPEFRNSELR